MDDGTQGVEGGAITGQFAVSAAARTHRGLVRRTNEDAYLVMPPMFAVADGLGGLAAGEVASGLAIDVLAGGPQPPDPTALVALFREASVRIRVAASEDERLTGMGTTCTAMVLSNERAEIAHVGDTRAYLVRNGTLRLLTQDHSLAQELVRVGRLSESEAAAHVSRNTLTRALGTPGELDVDRASSDLLRGDRLLLCSDGLTGSVPDDRVAMSLVGDSPGEAADRLIGLALDAGGPDNVTVIVIDIQDPPSRPTG
jgi:protein phosphatase